MRSIDNGEILLEDLVEGGRLRPVDVPGQQGVVIGHSRLNRVSYIEKQRWDDDVIEGLIMLRRARTCNS